MSCSECGKTVAPAGFGQPYAFQLLSEDGVETYCAEHAAEEIIERQERSR